MARRSRRPIIGRRALGPQLSPKVRQILHHRATKQARREYGPAIDAAKAQVGAAKRERRQAVQSVTGASRVAERFLGRAQRDLKGSGLKGRYRKQVAQEIGGRQSDIASSLPAQVSATRAEFAPDIASAREGVAGARVDRAQNAAQTFGSMVDKALTQARGIAKERQGKRLDRREKHAEKGTEVKRAVHRGRLLLAQFGTKNVPENEKEWSAFEMEVAKAEEVGPDAARRARKILERRLLKNYKRAITTGPFRPG